MLGNVSLCLLGKNVTNPTEMRNVHKKVTLPILYRISYIAPTVCPIILAFISLNKTQGFGYAFFLRIWIRAKIFMRIRIRGVKEKKLFGSKLPETYD